MIYKTLTFIILTHILLSCKNNDDNKKSGEKSEITNIKDTIVFTFVWQDIIKKFKVNDIEVNELPRNKEIDLVFHYKKRSGKVLSKLNLDLSSDNSNLKITKVDNFHFRLFIKKEYEDKENLTRIKTYYSPKKNQILFNVFDSIYYEFPEKIEIGTYCGTIEQKKYSH